MTAVDDDGTTIINFITPLVRVVKAKYTKCYPYSSRGSRKRPVRDKLHRTTTPHRVGKPENSPHIYIRQFNEYRRINRGLA